MRPRAAAGPALAVRHDHEREPDERIGDVEHVPREALHPQLLKR